MPGLIEVGRQASLGIAIEEILLVAEASREDEWEGVILYLPLR
jgi:hypothetical protein